MGGTVWSTHFSNISEWFQDTFVDTIKSFEGVVYGVAEIVPLAGTSSDKLYISAHGKFALNQPEENKLVHEAGEYYAEVSLYTRALHMSTLTAMAYSDAFVLEGVHFADCARKPPGCIFLVVKCALAFTVRSV